MLVALAGLLAIVCGPIGVVLLFFRRSRRVGKYLLGISAVLFVITFGAVLFLDAPLPRTQSAMLSVEQVKARASPISYEQLAREPDRHKGLIVVFRGKTAQVIESGQNITLRVDVTLGTYGIWRDTVYVNYLRESPSEARILDGDILTIWGEYIGIKSYTAVLNRTIQIPHVVARSIERY